MVRPILLGSLLFFLCFSVVLARPGQVRTKDGRTLEGDITDNGPDGVTIKTRVGSVTLRQADVGAITYAANIRELYEQRRKELPKDAGARSHLDLARWLYDNKEYELARGEADAALAIEPNNADAAFLRQSINQSIAWSISRASASGSAAASASSRPAAPSLKGRRLLDADQINLMRQHELKESDTRARVRLPAEVQRQYAQSTGQGAAEFNSLPDYAKALRIIKNGTPEMRQEIKILTDPQVILDYKRTVRPTIMSGCATANCHGGTKAGNLVLYYPDTSDPLVYTNLYILSKYGRKVEGEIEGKAINRMYPTKSLLAQYGLPREKAEFKHPPAGTYNGIFRDESDPKFQTLINWMASLVPLEPQYAFDIPVPTGISPATQPDLAQTPQAKQRPEREKQQPPNDRKGNDANDALREGRERIRPINPGSIPIPPLPF